MEFKVHIHLFKSYECSLKFTFEIFRLHGSSKYILFFTFLDTSSNCAGTTCI